MGIGVSRQQLNFKSTLKKSPYHSCVNVMHVGSKWSGLRSVEAGVFPMRALEVPVQTPCGEPQIFRDLRMATNGRLAHIDSARDKDRPLFQEEKSIDYLFLKCKDLEGLLGLIKGWCGEFKEGVTKEPFHF